MGGAISFLTGWRLPPRRLIANRDVEVVEVDVVENGEKVLW